ncbi:hypothetical protein ANCCEY_08626 [Ancylostoma ceylanicum]|uniref:Uncharacterized protein n=1 Tax=Ancylostoma ceylanicum TaxID=53326 RepID=A0A0D6LXD7_9BILA|nr:hypothetical protein ANCCEY_08626 [Ancylostoma ceylanicum]
MPNEIKQRRRTHLENQNDVEIAAPLNTPTTCTNATEHRPIERNLSTKQTQEELREAEKDCKEKVAEVISKIMAYKSGQLLYEMNAAINFIMNESDM